ACATTLGSGASSSSRRTVAPAQEPCVDGPAASPRPLWVLYVPGCGLDPRRRRDTGTPRKEITSRASPSLSGAPPAGRPGACAAGGLAPVLPLLRADPVGLVRLGVVPHLERP